MPGGTAAAGPQARAHAAVPAGRRKGASLVAPLARRGCLGLCPRRPSDRLPPSFLRLRLRAAGSPRSRPSGCTPGSRRRAGFQRGASRCAETQGV